MNASATRTTSLPFHDFYFDKFPSMRFPICVANKNFAIILLFPLSSFIWTRWVLSAVHVLQMAKSCLQPRTMYNADCSGSRHNAGTMKAITGATWRTVAEHGLSCEISTRQTRSTGLGKVWFEKRSRILCENTESENVNTSFELRKSPLKIGGVQCSALNTSRWERQPSRC